MMYLLREVSWSHSIKVYVQIRGHSHNRCKSKIIRCPINFSSITNSIHRKQSPSIIYANCFNCTIVSSKHAKWLTNAFPSKPWSTWPSHLSSACSASFSLSRKFSMTSPMSRISRTWPARMCCGAANTAVLSWYCCVSVKRHVDWHPRRHWLCTKLCNVNRYLCYATTFITIKWKRSRSIRCIARKHFNSVARECFHSIIRLYFRWVYMWLFVVVVVCCCLMRLFDIIDIIDFMIITRFCYSYSIFGIFCILGAECWIFIFNCFTAVWYVIWSF